MNVDPDFRQAFKFLVFLFVALSLSANSPGAQQDPGQPTPKEIQLSSPVLDALQGFYRSDAEPENTISFFHEGQGFFAERPRMARTELFASAPDTFFLKQNNTRFIFSVAAEGQPASVKIITAETSAIAKKISDTPVSNGFRPYQREEAMIPMRDGLKLHAVILRPSDNRESLPFIFNRTPYGVASDTSDTINQQRPELARSGYIFVLEDIRGRYQSEGQFIMMRPMIDHSAAAAGSRLVDESTDAFDTISWLLKNIPNNNGRVGVVGTSYDGFLTMEAGIDPHPAIKAISPQAPMTDVWLGDDFFHNGAFRQSYGYDYALGMESGKENAFENLKEDAYDFFLQAGSFAGAAKKSGLSQLPTWQSFIEHPDYGPFWQSRSVQPHLTTAAVPTLEVGGYWDQEDLWGPQEEYAALESHDLKHEIFLVLGPWNHGQWSRTTRHLGQLNFGAAVGDQFRQQIEAPFFAKYLKDEAGFDLQDTASFQTGSNRWKRYAHWPPAQNVSARNLYLGAQGTLTFNSPSAPAPDSPIFSEYISDPANPIPYRKRPIEATYAPAGSQWYAWLAQDQHFLDGRKDLASWSTPVLDREVTVTGDVVADLFASTTGTDSDWVVKLIDVYPPAAVNSADPEASTMSNFQLMIADEIFRARYRTNFEKPEALKPGKIDEYKFSLHAADHVFLKGHRIMVQVQSTWFPLYDRNPQKFVPNIMTASPGDYQPATQRVYFSPKYPSHLKLPVAAPAP